MPNGILGATPVPMREMCTAGKPLEAALNQSESRESHAGPARKGCATASSAQNGTKSTRPHHEEGAFLPRTKATRTMDRPYFELAVAGVHWPAVRYVGMPSRPNMSQGAQGCARGGECAAGSQVRRVQTNTLAQAPSGTFLLQSPVPTKIRLRFPC
eukprot:CAMPEP_0174329572 /NCGR_PEP_ID=MMETSP0810-20121108/15966_1 /TAXON_ID=73025 ORGANISM="Eutreptiella gymnastica-like, Strain CCMP1594" /NCGR_SAMPLE_ID=MMETSP0810 /ASSEMBLY_ACC=CAM_ASM_000659 /LENGTH=155 /DNA_ID=CAMNT_0015444183 /DNA_START=800 /DNA_END=1268 /DNA_ORIENTATION=+